MLSREETINLQNKFQGHSDDHLTAYPVQVQGQQMYRDTADNRFLKLRDGEELHHKVIIQTLEPFYRGLDDSESVELTRYIQQDLGIAVGNNARNHMPMNIDDHKDIHRLAVEIGAQVAPATFNTGNFKDPALGRLLEYAGTAGLEESKDLARIFLGKVMPQMEERIDDLKAARDFQEEVDKGYVFDAIQSLPANNKDVNELVKRSSALERVRMFLRG